jgi:hypothetical protein
VPRLSELKASKKFGFFFHFVIDKTVQKLLVVGLFYNGTLAYFAFLAALYGALACSTGMVHTNFTERITA